MSVDWQIVAVWLIILAALAYVGRRGWTRARSFRARGEGGEASSSSSCATGCGSCGDERPRASSVAAKAARSQNVLVQITNASSGGAKRRPE